jgi:hypothetical protein
LRIALWPLARALVDLGMIDKTRPFAPYLYHLTH